MLGLDLETHSVELKRRIGVVPEGLALFERLSGTQLLNFVGRMHGLTREVAAQRTAELLEFMELRGAADQLVVDYSHGMEKKWRWRLLSFTDPRSCSWTSRLKA